MGLFTLTKSRLAVLCLLLLIIAGGLGTAFLLNGSTSQTEETATLTETSESVESAETSGTLDSIETTASTEVEDVPTDAPAAPRPASKADLTLDFSKGNDFYTVTKQESHDISSGIIYTSLSLQGVGDLSGQLQAVNMLAVDPYAPGISVEFAPQHKVISMQAVSKIAEGAETDQKKAIGAFNLDFFDMSNGMPLGLQISHGEIITLGQQITTTFAVMADKTVSLGLGSTADIVLTSKNGQQLQLTGINKVRSKKNDNHVFLLNNKFDGTTRSEGDGVEVMITPADKSTAIRAGQTIQGKVEQVLTSANNDIPDGQLVVTASGQKAAWIKENLSEGDPVSIHTSFSNAWLTGAEHAYGGGNHSLAYTILFDKEIPFWLRRSSKPSLTTDRHPRTLAASKDGLLYIFTFDGRQSGYASGISFQEAALYLAALGMETVVNLDGGGSTTFAVRLPDDDNLTVVNRPSDGRERAVSNALVIFQNK